MSGILALLICILVAANYQVDITEVPFTERDVRVVDDGAMELIKLGFRIEIYNDRLTNIAKLQKDILKPYCKCSDNELEDYLNDKGLPSIVNRMKESMLSDKDTAAFEAYTDRFNELKELRDSALSTREFTAKLIVNRLTDSFKSQGGTQIDKFNLRLKDKKFVKRIPSDPGETFEDAVYNHATEQMKSMDRKQVQKIIQDEINLQLPPSKRQPSKPHKKSPPKKRKGHIVYAIQFD